MRRACLILLVLLVSFGTMASAGINEAVGWLKGKQGEWSNIALRAAGQQIRMISTIPAGDITTDWERRLLEESAVGNVKATTVAKIVQVQRSTGKFANTVKGQGEALVNAHIWGIVALSAAGETIPNKSLAFQWLLNRQHADGGFHFDAHSRSSEVDMTAMALLAFKAMGGEANHAHVQKAFSYLQKNHLSSGAFGLMGAENAESTAVVIQALVAYGYDPKKWNGKNAVTALQSFQQADGGFAHLKRARAISSLMATEQAVLALSDVGKGTSWVTRFREQNLKITDMKSGDWGYPQVRKLLVDGVLSGFPGHSFKPKESMTRAQFATMLVQYAGLPSNRGTTFRDVPSSHWANPFIQAAAAKGWVKGVSAGQFAPDKTLTGAEAITILANYKGLSAPKTTPWYQGFVDVGRKQGWLYPGFQPTQPINRVQAAWMLDTIRQK